MTTANLIMAVCLVALMGVAAWLIVRYMRKTTEVELKAQSLASAEKETAKRKAALDKWCAELKTQKTLLVAERAAWEDNKKHVYANFEVLDSLENKPTIKAIGKSLSSKIGYALRKEYPVIKETRDDKKGGRTVYSVDVYFMPYADAE